MNSNNATTKEKASTYMGHALEDDDEEPEWADVEIEPRIDVNFLGRSMGDEDLSREKLQNKK